MPGNPILGHCIILSNPLQGVYRISVADPTLFGYNESIGFLRRAVIHRIHFFITAKTRDTSECESTHSDLLTDPSVISESRQFEIFKN